MQFKFDIEPARASSNRRHSASTTDNGFGRRMYQACLDELALYVKDQRNKRAWPTLNGKVVVRLTTYVADERGVDVDACVKCVLDALQAGKAIRNDKQVKTLIATRAIDGRPRIEVDVSEVE
jgi:Holliday junction resolvase RusA-like endonuclease